MTKLSVNVNKLATIRNSRGKNNPDVVKTALDIVRFGAHGITVHPRPDERHIRRQDVYDLKKRLAAEKTAETTAETTVEFNIEGYPSDDFLCMVEEVRPEQCTLVPDPPHVLTSNAGWRVSENHKALADTARRLQNAKVRASVFVEPKQISQDELSWLADQGIQRVELYTESFAENYATPAQEKVTGEYIKTAEMALKAGLAINAGHDLNLDNLGYFARKIPQLAEVSIGHALICDALYLGLQETVRRYLGCLNTTS